MRTISELNFAEHYRRKGSRHKKQKNEVWFAMLPYKGKIPLPCHIHLTRIAPRILNRHDNLACSFKYIVDEVCNQIIPGLAPGRADDSPLISVSYDQMKGGVKEYGVTIEIFF